MYAIINQETGELVAENFIFFGKPKKAFDKNYVKVFTAFLDSIVEDDEIAGKSIRLLFYMMGRLNYNSYQVEIITSKAIKDLGISKKTFYIWVETLTRKGIIKKVDRYTYQITPYLFVKGDGHKAMDNLIDETEKEEQKKRKKRTKEKKKNRQKESE